LELPDAERDHGLLDRVASAIYDAQVKRARQSVEEYDFQLDRMKQFFALIPLETDRSLAILLFALAEDLMLSSLKYYMSSKTKAVWDQATSGNGVLATASDRISILELLGWMHPNTAKHLRLMKNIRNRFAHHADVNDFSDKKIMSWISTMAPLEIRVTQEINKNDFYQKIILESRDLFIIRSILIITMLVNDLSVLPAAKAQQVSARHVNGIDFDDGPAPLQELRRIAASSIISICFRKREA
jgi:DNA-binding MltR family transcriptional regulator